jgi:hypothetical protein
VKENRHSVIVHCQFKEALAEIIRWGEAPWWPKNSLMRFTRQDLGPVQKGTRYRQKVILPFAPSWDVEVTDVTAFSTTRRFLNGLFCGQETVRLQSEGETIKVFYAMIYEVNGIFNKILWALVFRRLHDNNIETILANLKDFLEKRD